jgi:Tol biopolymer transport system component
MRWLLLRSVSIAASLVALLACGAEPGPKKPMGQLPSATTTAQPEWLPFAIRAGSAAPVDERERHLAEPRRLTEGWNVDAIAWSPDATEIAIVAKAPNDKQSGLWIVPLVPGSPRRVSADQEQVLGLTGTLSGDFRVVYWVDGKDGPGMREWTAAGSPRPLAVSGIKARSAALSPDGSALYLVGDTPKDRGVFQSAEAGPRLLIADKGAGAGLAVSADRSYVAWPTEEGGQRRIMMASVEGRGARAIYSGPTGGAAGGSLAFVAGTKRLLFASDLDAAEREIYAADLTVKDALPERVTFSQGDAPSAAPDGSLIAFASMRGGGTRDLYVARWIDDP